jgi:twitching motility two-component system response regulator PilH
VCAQIGHNNNEATGQRANPSEAQVMSTVLIVDDSSTLREMIAGLLLKAGMTVLEAKDGLEAQKIIEAAPPDLVVLDIVMPNMNGYELCRWLKNSPQTKEIPVIICSSKGEEFDRYWGMKQGADAYITKPFRPMDMIGTVKQLLR